MALQAVLTVSRPSGSGQMTTTTSAADNDAPASNNPYTHRTEVDIKRYAKVEKIPGGEISDCQVLKLSLIHI